MIKNYFKTAWRYLRKNGISSVINIGGLSLGVAVAMLVGLWIYDECSFNHYHENYAQIAQVMVKGVDPKRGPFINNSIQYPLATAIQNDYKSHFTYIVRSSWVNSNILSAGEKKLSETGLYMDPGAPDMLSLKMRYGSRDGLHDPHSILLAASVATALFGHENPVNKTVIINNKTAVAVTGVYEDLPQNTQFRDLKFLSAWDLWVGENDWILKRATTDWFNHFLKLYVAVNPNTDFETVSAHIKDAELQNVKNLDAYREDAALQPQVFLHPMSRWHLYPYRMGITDSKPVTMVWMIGIIGVFVLLLACINFMNLSTARSEKRAREVGVRKTMGSRRAQLVGQFLSESLVMVLASFVLACGMVVLALPWFNQLAAKEMAIPYTNIFFWLFSAVFIVLTALVAGSYPAFFLSSFQPVKVLKGSFRSGRLAAVPRKVLVVTQFTVSIALIISTIVVYRQLQFAKDRPVGYDREGLITMEMKSGDFNGKYDLLRTELLKTGVINNMSESMGRVTEVASGNGGFDWKGRSSDKDKSFATLAVTPDHGGTVGWQFVAGRDFSPQLATDSAGIVMNEAAVRYTGLKNPVGETITWKWHDDPPKAYTVLGVVHDMVMASPYEPVEPTFFFIKALNGGVNWINIRVKPGIAMQQALPKIEAVFKKIVPAVPFDYKFVDEEYAVKFAAEERTSKLAAFFATLAVVISCLGLFGLATFVAEQKTKEIGIRKVLGASLFDVWRLLSMEFAGLVFISLLIAAPIAYYFMHSWLQHYPYHVALSGWVFAWAGSGALALALITVSFQAIKAGVANPVKSLRTE